MATTGDKSTRNIPEYRQIKPHTHMCTYTCTYARTRADIPTGNSAPKKFSLRPIYAAAAAAADAVCSGARALCRQEIFVPFPLPDITLLPLSLAPHPFLLYSSRVVLHLCSLPGVSLSLFFSFLSPASPFSFCIVLPFLACIFL